MRTVEAADGRRYLLLKESSDASLVRDPETGEKQYLPNETLTDVAGTSPLVTAASGVSEPVRRVLGAVHDERSLGLLVELVDRGPVGAVDLLGSYDLCESDFLGLLTEFRAAGLARETSVHGERAYDATDVARDGVGRLRGDGDTGGNGPGGA